MDIQFDEKTKKLLIALLLFVSCAVSAVMLSIAPEHPNQPLESFSQADSLILKSFRKFNISPDQVRVAVIRVDSHLVRKRYRVHLPPGFEKTVLHADLNRTFSRLSVKTPATVELPEYNMLIQLLYTGTVFRTIDLRTDPALELERNYASVMVAFDSAPSRSLLNEVVRLGESIPVVLRVADAGQADEMRSDLQVLNSRIYYWLTRDAEPAGDESASGDPLPPLLTLREFQPRVHILSFTDLSTRELAPSREAVKLASDKQITFVDASNAMILDSNLGEQLFKQELEKFAQQAVNGTHPVAIVLGDERALEWLHEKLNDLKLRGLYLTKPPEINF
ncbi:MAG: hypothetical protein R3224_02495 [Balneolaceae bacterium]|nr:hypothetical protein [Balneolaceae bacterium]